jgi:hypothetical protein
MVGAPHEATASAAAARLEQNAPTAGNASWVAADNSDPATSGRLIAATKDRFGRLLQSQAEQACRVESMHSWPAVGFVADEA